MQFASHRMKRTAIDTRRETTTAANSSTRSCYIHDRTIDTTAETDIISHDDKR